MGKLAKQIIHTMVTNKLSKTFLQLSLCLGLWLLCLQHSFATERWQVVILADNSVTNNLPALAPELTRYTDINHAITQGLTRVLNAADFDIHSSDELGFNNCKLESCFTISLDNIRAAMQRSDKTLNLALFYQFSAFKQRHNSITRWHFTLSGRLLDIDSGIQQDAFTVTNQRDEPQSTCIAECAHNWLTQELNFLTQELGTVLAEKLNALPRRYYYDLQMQNFTPQELQHTAHYLQTLDTYVADTLIQEYATHSQWLHQVASRDYQYVSELSSSELGSSLAHFLDAQGMQVSITYHQSPGLFILTRQGTPYLARYISLAVILLFCLASLLVYKKNQRQQALITPHNKALMLLLILCLVFALGLYWHSQKGTFAWLFNQLQPAAEPPSLVVEQTPEREQTQLAEHETKKEAKKEQQDENDWQQASKINTQQSYQFYLNRWPDGIYLLQASAALKAKTDDEAAWQAALNLATVEAYQDYLDNQPAGDFRQRALQKLTLLFKHFQQSQKLKELIALAEDYYYQQKNYGEARYYYQQAAELDDALAQYQLGQMYSQAQGTTQNQQLATKWYRQAAQQSHTQAQFKLAYRYSKGLGLKQDHQQSIYWYQLAAEQGHLVAQYNLAYIFAQGQVTGRDYQQAAYWYQKAAAQGDADAQNNLGKLYENGQGVIKDPVKARRLYRQAAAQGHQLAKINLSLLRQ
ncbi:tetratricopeptide repeat protein [Paraglaciecola sp.]|uniref:tetratricopeptide repeat protein n=1 Tax=Paraglaciecola sp. TaxID=1920173 RepID=UPI0030F48762